MGKKIYFLNKVSIDGLSLIDFDTKNKECFKEILNKVLDYNKEQQGADLYDASAFPQYYKKLLELYTMLE